MSKIKTLRSANKRFKRIDSGRYKFKHAYSRHILTKKSTKHKRHLRTKSILSEKNTNRIMKYLPYV